MWNLRLELGHQLHPDPARTTEFAPALPSAPKETPAQAPAQGYGKASVALPWKAGRFSGQDFALQPDGMLRCPADQSLVAHERRREADGSLRVVYAESRRSCRPCALREQCQWNGSATAKPRQVSVLLHPLVIGSLPILWRDWSRRQHRQACIQLVRKPRVGVEVGPSTSATLAVKPVPLSRAERAHSRLAWTQRLARPCPLSNGWSGDDQAVRRPARLCHLTRQGSGLTWPTTCLGVLPLGQACFSERSLLASFPGCVAFPLLFCPVRAFSPCFCHLFHTQRSVQHSFRSPAKRLTLRQSRCAIRGCYRPQSARTPSGTREKSSTAYQTQTIGKAHRRKSGAADFTRAFIDA